MLFGQLTIEHWSVAQKAMPLYSAGPELYAAMRAIVEAEGFKSFGNYFGEDFRILTWDGIQATTGLSFRSGLDKARHILTMELWIQGLLERGECEHWKVGVDRNPADMSTQPVPQCVLVEHLQRSGCHPV